MFFFCFGIDNESYKLQHGWGARESIIYSWRTESSSSYMGTKLRSQSIAARDNFCALSIDCGSLFVFFFLTRRDDGSLSLEKRDAFANILRGYGADDWLFNFCGAVASGGCGTVSLRNSNLVGGGLPPLHCMALSYKYSIAHPSPPPNTVAGPGRWRFAKILKSKPNLGKD